MVEFVSINSSMSDHRSRYTQRLYGNDVTGGGVIRSGGKDFST